VLGGAYVYLCMCTCISNVAFGAQLVNCLFSPALFPQELHATEVHPCAHADVAAAVLACTPHIPMMDATGRFPFPPTFPSGVEEWATEFLLEQQPGNAAAAAPAGPAISKASSPIQQEGQKKILSGGVSSLK